MNDKKNNLNIYDTMTAIIDHLGSTARVVDNGRNNDKFIEFQVDNFPEWRFAAVYDFKDDNVYIIGDRKDLIKRFEPFYTMINCESVDEFLLDISNMKQEDAIKYCDVRKNYEEDIDRILTEELNKNNILNGFGLHDTVSLFRLIIPVIHPDSLEKRNKLFSDFIRLRRKLLDCCIEHGKQLEDNKLSYLPRLYIYWIPKLDLDYNIATCIDRLYRDYKPYKILTKEKRGGQNNRKLKRVRMINRVRRNISL